MAVFFRFRGFFVWRRSVFFALLLFGFFLFEFVEELFAVDRWDFSDVFFGRFELAYFDVVVCIFSFLFVFLWVELLVS